MIDLEYLITYLATKKSITVALPESEEDQLRLFFALSRDYIADPAEDEFFITVQDRVLLSELKKRRTVSLSALSPVSENIYVLKCDPTLLSVDAIINCTDEELMGCFVPCSQCINEKISSRAGVQLQTELVSNISVAEQKKSEAKAFITQAYCLPSKFVIHPSLGRFTCGDPDSADEALYMSLYSRLHLAWLNSITSVALCCAFGYSADPAAVASSLVSAVRGWLSENPDYPMKIVFNVLTEDDKKLLLDILAE